MWQRILALVLKEFLALLKDKRSRVVVIVPPLIQLLVFGYAATFDLNDVPYAVYDEDRGQRVARPAGALRRLRPTSGWSAASTHDGEIAPLDRRASALLVLHIGPHFSARPARGPAGAAAGHRRRPQLEHAPGRAQLRATRSSRLQRGLERRPAAGSGRRRNLVTRAWFNPNLESRWFFVPGIVGLLTLVVTMLVTALSVAREREQGTFDQLLVTPLRPVEILIGKALPGLRHRRRRGDGDHRWSPRSGSGCPSWAACWCSTPGSCSSCSPAVGVGLMISVAGGRPSSRACSARSSSWCRRSSCPASPPRSPTCRRRCRSSRSSTRCAISWSSCAGSSSRARGSRLSVGQMWPMALIGFATLALAGWLFRHRMY